LKANSSQILLLVIMTSLKQAMDCILSISVVIHCRQPD